MYHDYDKAIYKLDGIRFQADLDIVAVGETQADIDDVDKAIEKAFWWMIDCPAIDEWALREERFGSMWRMTKALIANVILSAQHSDLMLHGVPYGGNAQKPIYYIRRTGYYSGTRTTNEEGETEKFRCKLYAGSGPEAWHDKLFSKLLQGLAERELITMSDIPDKTSARHGVSSSFTASVQLIEYLAWSAGLSAANVASIEKPLVELRTLSRHKLTDTQRSALKPVMSRVERINAHLRKNEATYTNEQGQVIKVPPYAGHVSRIFNGTWHSFGRFYGYLERLTNKKDGSYREQPTITLRGEQTIALDYSAFHPHIAYALADIEIDPTRDLYKVKRRQTAREREILKKLMLVALNAQRRSTAIFETAAEFGEQYKRVERLATYMEREHAPIHQFLYGGASGLFQYIDSEIADHILIAASEMDMPIVPVHDGFIVRESDLHKLGAAMSQAAACVTGVELPYKLEA